jgi:hypothetical protein
VLDRTSWQLENTATGEWCRFAEQDLPDRFASHGLVFECPIQNGETATGTAHEPVSDQFGLMFEKNWIFDRGGRPVIYQPESELDLLPENLRWRDVRFEPTGDKVIDFT